MSENQKMNPNGVEEIEPKINEFKLGLIIWAFAILTFIEEMIVLIPKLQYDLNGIGYSGFHLWCLIFVLTIVKFVKIYYKEYFISSLILSFIIKINMNKEIKIFMHLMKIKEVSKL